MGNKITTELERLSAVLAERSRVRRETEQLIEEARKLAERDAHYFAQPIRDNPNWREGPDQEAQETTDSLDEK